MNISELINNEMGQTLVNNISAKLGMEPKEAATAVQAAVPTILAGLNRNIQTPEGANSLASALDNKHDGSLLDRLGDMLQNNQVEMENDGHGILGHIFGAQKPQVEQGLSQKTGISINKMGPILALLAPIVLSYIGKQKRETNTQAGGLGGLLGGILGGGSQSHAGIGGMLSGMLDKNKDGNILDDVMGMFTGKK